MKSGMLLVKDVRLVGKTGHTKDAIELLVVPGDELAHYSKATTDLCTSFHTVWRN